MKGPKVDWLVNLHRYSVGEIAESFTHARANKFTEADGGGLYFYAADHIERLVGLQESKIRELERSLKRMRDAHDKLFKHLKRVRSDNVH